LPVTINVESGLFLKGRKKMTTPKSKKPYSFPQPSSAAAWKEKSSPFDIIPLPSGANVKIKKARLLDYIMSGYLPLYAFDEIQSISQRMTTSENALKIEPADLQKLYGWVDKVVVLSCESPKVVESDPDEDSVLVSDISFEDKLEIFNHIMREGRALLGSFRQK
jgi:hypothetical protein